MNLDLRGFRDIGLGRSIMRARQVFGDIRLVKTLASTGRGWKTVVGW